MLSPKFTTLSIFIALTAIASVIGSLGMFAVAGNSHPGDTLFPLKLKLEDVRVRSADDSTDQARLYLQFAGRRLSEMPYLLSAGRYDDFAFATSDFARNIRLTSDIVRTLSVNDPVQADVLNSEVLFLLRIYSEILASNLVSIPAAIQPVVGEMEDVSPSAVAAAQDDNSRRDDDGSGVPAVMPTMTPMPVILPTATPLSAPTSLPTSLPTSPPTSAPAVSNSISEDGTCQGLIGAITVENLRVPPGASCTLDGTRVQGNIKVENGASLTAQRVTVIGNIQAEGASFVDVLAGSTVDGSIQIKQGGSARAEYVIVNGDIQYEANQGAFNIVGNQVGGNIQVFQNAGGITIGSNIVNGNLQCKENNPAPGGGNNVVQGNKEDQCAQL